MQVLGPVLQQHRAALPHHEWKSVCMKAMHAIGLSIDSLQKQASTQESNSTDSLVTAACVEAPVNKKQASMRWEDLTEAMLVMQHKLMHTMHAHLRTAGSTQVRLLGLHSYHAAQSCSTCLNRSCVQNAAATVQCIEGVRIRMLEHSMAVAACSHMYMLCDPHSSRTIVATQGASQSHHGRSQVPDLSLIHI